MNKPWKIIAELEALSGTKDKENVVLREALAGNDEFFAGFNAAMNSYVTYGIKKVPAHKAKDGAGLTWINFKQVLDALAARLLTGHAARDRVAEMMSQATAEQWDNWYARILRRDMKCKCTDGKINKQVKAAVKQTGNKNLNKYLVPVFSCQLAEDSGDHPKKLKGKKIIQLKLDGVRVLTVVSPDAPADKVVEQFSRNGRQLVNFPHIVEQFQQVADILDEPMVFDGEVMSENFQLLMTQLNRKSNVKSTDAILNLFDLVPYSTFLHGKDGIYKASQTDRCEALSETLNCFKQLMPNVVVLDYEIVDLDTSAGRQRFNEINEIAIANKFEGIMIKDLDAGYKCKRGDAWLKQKPVITVDLEIVGFENGKVTGKRRDILGAFVCEGTHNGKKIQVNVGSGLTEKQTEQFWLERDKLLGQIIEITADAITQNSKDAAAGVYSLRFPRFERFRGFDPGEKI